MEINNLKQLMKDIGFEVCKIEAMGWEVEDNYSHALNLRIYRAFQGGFKTLWRDNLKDVLKDIENIVKARKEQTSVPF